MDSDCLEYTPGSKMDLRMVVLNVNILYVIPLMLEMTAAGTGSILIQILCSACQFTTHILPCNILCCSNDKRRLFEVIFCILFLVRQYSCRMSAQQIQYYQKSNKILNMKCYCISQYSSSSETCSCIMVHGIALRSFHHES
jgi:hypothetical protein